MKRQFPVYTLFVDVPLDFVDVNVHPNKSDVRFVNNTVMYGTIYKVISAVLDGTAKATDFIVGDSAVPKICEPYADMPKNQSGEAIEYNQTGKIYDKNFNDIQSMPNFEQEKGKEKPKNKLAIDDKFDYTPYENYVPPITNPRKNQIDAYYGEMMNVPTKVCGNSVTDVRTPLQVELDNLSVTMQQQHIDYDCCKFQGKLFNTYLLYELRDEIYMIDQHAAHERLLFDEFMQKVKDRKIAKQGMVVSFILDLNATESQFISSNLQVLRSMGFDIEPFGMNAYRIKAIPADLQDINLQQFFADLLSDINSLKEITLENVLKEKIATMACKHAVKGGMDLTEQEREKLFEMVKDNLGLKCPHGRPICVKLTKTQIERMFKRIV
jgi:DNA mismatch repair protein MutL